MDSIINVKVRGNHLSKDNRNAGVQYEANVTHLRIDFDEGWDGYAKTVTFWDALMGNPTKITLTTDKLEDILVSPRTYLIPIPGEAMTEAGYPTFVIDGFVDGKRKRSLADTLWVKEAPYDEDAGEPADPTPSQAEQLQVQVDQIIGTIQNAAQSAADAQSNADFALLQARTAGENAQDAMNQAITAGHHRLAAEAAAQTAQTVAGSAAQDVSAQLNRQVAAQVAEAEQAKNEAANSAAAAAKSADEARAAAGGDFVTRAGDTMSGDLTIHKAVPAHNLKATETRSATLMKNANGDVDLGAVLRDQSDGKQADLIVRAAEDKLFFVVNGVEYEVYGKHNLSPVVKSGDTMTGILTFDSPGLFSAIQKRRTINGKNYILRLGIGNDGNGASACLRLFSVAEDGTETAVSHIEADSTGVSWVSPGGIRKTIAHSGNIGVLTASLE